MKYFAINCSSDPNVIGRTSPQSQESIIYSGIHGMSPFMWNSKLKIPNDFIYPVPILDKRAKITDLISHCGFSSFSLLVSEKLNVLLKTFLVKEDLLFFETTLKTKTGDLKYWGISPLVSRDEYIDFENSTISLTNWTTKEKNIIPIKNNNEYQELIKKEYGVSYILIEKLKIKSQENNDFFCIRNVINSDSFFVSDKLRLIILDLKFTGISFMEF